MKPGMSSIDEARFTRGVRFAEEQMGAFAGAAKYVLEKGTLRNGGYIDMTWPFAAGAQSTVTTVGNSPSAPPSRASFTARAAAISSDVASADHRTVRTVSPGRRDRISTRYGRPSGGLET